MAILCPPANKSEFIDREEISNLLQKRVKAFIKGYRQNIALFGPEMTGKTSIISKLILDLEEEDNLMPVYISLMEEPISRFATRFMKAVLYYALKKDKRYFKEIRPSEELSVLKDKAHNLCPRLIEHILRIEKLLEHKRSTQALGALFDLLPEVKKEINKPVLLILDEFHFITDMNIKRPYLTLGERIISQKDVMYIITSSEVGLGKEILAHDLSLLFGNFEQVMITCFDYRASREFLHQRLKWVNIKPVHKRFLTAITGGHPFFMELLCHRIRDIVQENKIGQVPRNILAGAIFEEAFHPSSFIYQYMERILNTRLTGPARWTYIDLLTAIADGNKRVREIAKYVRLSATPVVRYLKRLVDTGFVRKCGSIYLIREPMFAAWLRFAYKKMIFSVDIDYAIYELDVKKEIEAQLVIFEEEETKTLSERLRHLFASFKNEIVKLNGHRFKLPHFNEVEHRVIKGIELPIVARAHNRYWIPHVLEKRAGEKDIRDVIEKFKKINYSISCKPLICLDGIETDARLAAQEAGLAIWEIEDINTLFDMYNQCPVMF